jgi:hypothetical protein
MERFAVVMQIQLKLQHHHLPLIAFRHLQHSSPAVPAVRQADLVTSSVTTAPWDGPIRHGTGETVAR